MLSKGVSLSGEFAADWLGMLMRSPARVDGLRLAADIYRAHDIALARVWTSGGVVINDDLGAAGVSITVLTEGGMVLRAGEKDYFLEKGDAVVYPTATLVSITSELPAAIIEVELGEGSADRFFPGLIDGPHLVPRTVGAVRVLSVLVNEILAGLDQSDPYLSRRYAIAVEAIAADLVEETDHDLPDPPQLV